ncbi:hypothetical protein N483_02115 [Pseudoalteromonas luteoviolacea NCIMB 1944]|nr:hypothetical protein N483_02115 [Pseudoalteromonas luteoviolacea NCIMB 1944]
MTPVTILGDGIQWSLILFRFIDQSINHSDFALSMKD